MSNTLEYKGYQATVNYEDGVLVIHVMHVSDHLVAECSDASKVEAEFRLLIDEYLEDCADLGKEPEKPFKGVFNVRVSPELHRLCARAAVSQGISLNELVTRALSSHVQPEISVAEIGWATVVHSSVAGDAQPIPVFATRPASAKMTSTKKGQLKPVQVSSVDWRRAQYRGRRH